MWTVDNPPQIYPKSTEKQLENPTQNQDKPTGKPYSKSIKTHWETQSKNSPNSLENPSQTILNGKLTWKAQRSRIYCPICYHYCRSIYYHLVFHYCYCQIFPNLLLCVYVWVWDMREERVEGGLRDLELIFERERERWFNLQMREKNV